MPLVVKFADSQKDKDQKKPTSTPQLGGGGGGSPSPFSATAAFDPAAAAIGAPALSTQGLQVGRTYLLHSLEALTTPLTLGPSVSLTGFVFWR